MSLSFSSPSNRDARARGAGVTAVLGPTNTGKTHLAIERMLAHSSGIIGLPLRLLAREVYNKCVERVGADAVALITGEEKIKPPSPRFWVSTLEAMPRDLDVAFVAIDEVQMGADLERGHVFTDRMLNRRGREETLVLGAQTVRPMVERLLPGAHVLTRPRLSQLTFAGEKKITRLPRRSAIVAFSAEEVYAIAELIRRQRGGAAVVLGALSPRTRNAQVALYQAGDVDYLVATDAIGMGLNLDVDHVAFASDRKFDGYQFRKLNPAEMGQIAGRAGRATRDGTFGTTGRCPAFETELVQALESHSFEPLKVLQWRNTQLDYFSVGALQASLAEVPKENGLTRAPIGEDILVLEHAVRDDDVRALAQTREAIERLWEVAQVPDYRKISPATHAELVVTLYLHLMRTGAIPIDWFARQVDEADRTDGDIDTLSNRIAHIRTWTFAANRPDWLADPEHWQGVTRAVEDKLSDALHERLTERFVDRRTSVLSRRLRENTPLDTDISKTGEVVVEGHAIGRLDGFTFTPAASAAGSEAKALAGAAQKALAGEIDARAHKLAQAKDEQFVLATDGTIRWLGQAVGKLVPGEEVLKPRVRIIADEHLTGAPRDAVQARLDLWLKTHIEKVLGPLFQLAAAEDITGIARGVAFQLVEALGVLERVKVAEDVKGLDQPARGMLRKYGVRFGAYHLYLPLLLKPAPRVLATQLHALKQDGAEIKGLDAIERLAASGRTSIAADKEAAKELYRTAGYRVCGERAVRVDILERLADIIRPALAWRTGSPGVKPAAAFEGGGFIVTVAMTSLAGCSGEEFASILRSLNYRMDKRPKPAEPPPAIVATAVAAPTQASAEPAVAEAGAPSASDSGRAIEAAPEEAAPELAAPPEATVEPAADVAAEPAALTASGEATAVASVPAPAEAASDMAPAILTVSEPTPEQSPAIEALPESAAPPVAASEPAAAEAAPAAAPDEPQMIEVWRPGRAEGQPRHRRPQPAREDRHRRDRRPAPALATPDAAQPAGEGAPIAADAAVATGTDATPGGEEHRRRRRRRRPERGERPAEAARPDQAVGSETAPPAEGQHRPQRADRADRPPHAERSERSERPPQRTERPERAPRSDRSDRGDRFPHGDRGERRDRGDRPERDPDLRAKYIKGRNDRPDRSSRDKAPDPNSPFAKLAALKEQLEANAKEGR
jgi:ATP-dependent RNA helicase SUPV3L1/SUV3